MLLILMAACDHPQTLQYDFGNSYHDTFAMQADLERPAAGDHAYPMGGMEGLLIRYRAMEQTTDEESGESEMSVRN